LASSAYAPGKSVTRQRPQMCTSGRSRTCLELRCNSHLPREQIVHQPALDLAQLGQLRLCFRRVRDSPSSPSNQQFSCVAQWYQGAPVSQIEARTRPRMLLGLFGQAPLSLKRIVVNVVQLLAQEVR
jgi:hypothetical protein